jgi:hypothetical protein
MIKMSKKVALTGTGMPPEQALAIAGAGSQGLTALGTNQATGLVIFSHLNAFSTVAASTGATLSSIFTPGDDIYVFNGGASTLTIYPNGSDTVDNTTSVTVATKKGVKLYCTSVASGVQAWTSHGST